MTVSNDAETLVSTPSDAAQTEGTQVDAPVVQLDDVPLNRFHAKMTVLTFGAHFTDGYSMGTIAIALSALSTQMEVSAVWQGLLGASALIGLFFGSLITGWISDKVGRQKIFLFSFALIALASFLQYFATTVGALFVLRVIVGFGIGGDYSVGVTLLTEFLPRRARGPLVGCLCTVWTVGYVAATLVGIYLVGSASWQLLLASAVIPAVIVLLMRIGTPESPRWLLRMGRRDEAQAIVDKYIGKGVKLEDNPVQSTGYRTLFTKRYLKLTLFVSIFWSFNVIPYFGIYTFLPTILDSFGLAENATVDILLNVVLMAGAAIGIWLLAKTTRRGFSIWSFALCAVCLLVISFLPGDQQTGLVISFVVFTVTIAAASDLTAVFPPEVFPTEARASGIGFATGVSRLASAIGTFFLPMLIAGIGINWTMFVMAMVCVAGTVLCVALAPETKDLTLADASAGVK